MTSVTQTFTGRRPERYSIGRLEKNFTSPSFDGEKTRPICQSEALLNKPPDDGPPPKHDYDKLLHRRKGISGSEFAGVGLQFAVTLVVFALGGIWLDKRLGTSPWLLIVLVLGGAALAFWTMIRKLKSGK